MTLRGQLRKQVSSGGVSGNGGGYCGRRKADGKEGRGRK